MSRKERAKDYVGICNPYTSGHWFRKKLIDSVVSSDEALINQAVPDEEELNEWETSPTPDWNKPLRNDDKRGGSQVPHTKMTEWEESNIGVR